MLLRRVWPARPLFDYPFSDLNHLRGDLLRLVDSALSEVRESGHAGVFPALNVTQDSERFVVRAEIPGLTADQLSISALHNRLTIAGKRELRTEEKVSYHRRERAEGSFSRTIALPSEVAPDRVEASYVDGVLTVALPKVDEAKPRQITVRS
jgi:HSP20 family protein